MYYDDILTLVRAGYSKAEIGAMAAGAAAPSAPSKQRPEAPAASQKPPAQQPAVQAPAQQPAATSTEALLQQLFSSVNTLTQAVQAQNRANITGNAPAQTVDDIAKTATARVMGVLEKE